MTLVGLLFVGTTASEAAYWVMVGSKGGLSAFWNDAITGFDGDQEALVRAAVGHPEREREAAWGR